MVPTMFNNFFLASTGAGGALIGLLFVAISIAPERSVLQSASTIRRATAASAFTALINAFFISFGSLLPQTNIGYFVLIFGLLGAFNSAQMGITLARQVQGWVDAIRRTFLVLGSFVVYGLEIYFGFAAIIAPHDVNLIYGMASLILAVYGIGLTRSWELLGAHRYGLLSWLSPVQAEDSSKG